MCFIYFYLTLEKNYWLFKVYLLEFDIGRLGKIWIQQGRRESKKFGQLCPNRLKSYWLISLLPTVPKVFEEHLLKLSSQ
jgi:hypothetical protein